MVPVVGDQPAVGDGDAVGIARQIGQNGLWAAERTLGIDDPFGEAQWGEKAAPFFANGACLKLACAARKRYSARNGGVEQDDLRWME